MDIFHLRNNLVGEYGQYTREISEINLEFLKCKKNLMKLATIVFCNRLYIQLRAF
jgi:hypothetical protein